MGKNMGTKKGMKDRGNKKEVKKQRTVRRKKQKVKD